MRMIHTPQTPENAQARWKSIREANEALQPWVTDQRQRLIEDQTQLARALRTDHILMWREYGFCLFAEETLRDFFAALLPKIA